MLARLSQVLRDETAPVPDRAALSALAQDLARDLPKDLPKDLHKDLADDPSRSVPGDGDAARAALTLLAEDPRCAAPLAALLNGPAPQKMLGVVEGSLLVGGLLLVLQTHVKIERSRDGTVTWKIEKKPTNAALLAPLLKKIVSLLS